MTERVISFSLWGDQPKYTAGALRNAELAPSIYPGWICRFHCGRSVPGAIVERLRGFAHVEVVAMAEPGDWRGLFWRFLAAADPGVEVMLSRDTDSRLTPRERAAVDAWLASDRDFHVMRDHPQHDAPILGGMWGVRDGLLRDMRALIDGFVAGDYWQVDQQFLASVVLPRVRPRWLEHDEYFSGRPFPTRRRGRVFVGQPFDECERPLAKRPAALAWQARRARVALSGALGRGTPRTLAWRPRRCLILQSAGVHTGSDGLAPNAHLRECWALQHAFRANGLEADVWGLRHPNFAQPPELDAYDLVVCAENYELDWLPDLGAARRALRLHWIIDLHCQDARVYRRVSRDCDVVLHATRRLIDGYARRVRTARHRWFPNAVDDRYFDAARWARAKRRDVVFVGNPHPRRDALLAALERRVGLGRLVATGDDMLDAVASARLHFNCNIGGDINFRTFETIGLGTALVTNRDPDLAALGFADGINCLLYDSADEAAAKIEAALADGSWERIGAAGYALSRRHTYTRRIAELLAALG